QVETLIEHQVWPRRRCVQVAVDEIALAPDRERARRSAGEAGSAKEPGLVERVVGLRAVERKRGGAAGGAGLRGPVLVDGRVGVRRAVVARDLKDLSPVDGVAGLEQQRDAACGGS